MKQSNNIKSNQITGVIRELKNPHKEEIDTIINEEFEDSLEYEKNCERILELSNKPLFSVPDNDDDLKKGLEPEWMRIPRFIWSQKVESEKVD